MDTPGSRRTEARSGENGPLHSSTRTGPCRPYRSPAQEKVVGLFRTTDHVRRALSQEVGRHGMTLQQSNALRILRGAGPEGIPALEVAERMVDHTPGVTRLLDRLERDGLIRRQRCPRDRRRVMAPIPEEERTPAPSLFGVRSEPRSGRSSERLRTSDFLRYAVEAP